MYIVLFDQVNFKDLIKTIDRECCMDNARNQVIHGSVFNALSVHRGVILLDVIDVI